MTTNNEKDQVRRLRAGDRTAFEAAIQAHYESVWRQHLLLTSSRDLAADLTQETFIDAWASLHTFRGKAALRTWLYTIAIRVWKRNLSTKRPETVSETASSDILEAMPARTPSPDKAVSLTLLNESILDALRKLPEPQRAVIVLCYRQEMTHAEAASALDIPVGTVKSRLHEGLRHLRRLLVSPAEEES